MMQGLVWNFGISGFGHGPALLTTKNKLLLRDNETMLASFTSRAAVFCVGIGVDCASGQSDRSRGAVVFERTTGRGRFRREAESRLGGTVESGSIIAQS